MIRIIFAALLMLTGLFTSQTALAGPPTDFVKTTQEKLFKVIAEPKSPARQEKLKALFDEAFKYDVMAEASLGQKWGELSDAQKKQFTELLTKLIRNNYKRNLTKMLDYKIEYKGEKQDGDSYVVQTIAKHKTDTHAPTIELDFRVKKYDGKFRVIDIVTERASLVKTYKSQFLKILRKDGFDKLIEKMKKKLDEQEKEG
ncbi:MAG TPA: ABC transporter substrate-binding protein [Polyangiaceae bacterium]|nr:ABC transporter substrate-binding protein [Polyangiaceae bacterium]